jgi:cytochrome c biogenesis protein CcdA/thiol-disulfide isomerase/thioredoxin
VRRNNSTQAQDNRVLVGLLLIFALVAGAGTAVSPCVLPVLPALLSAGATGGRRRPLGIVLGLAATFTITVAVLAKVVSGVGLGDTVLRDIAIGVLLVFGVALAVPSFAARIEAPLSRLARFGPKDTGDGFWSGVTVGAALGFVYTPCAGPILAAVISVGATTGTTLRTLLVAVAYAAGSAIVLLALMWGGRRVIPRTLNVQRVLGAVLIATAVAMIAQLDVRAEKAIAEHAPNANLAAGLEDSKAVGDRLDSIRPRARFAERTTAVGPRSKLPVLGSAPDFTGTQRWFNSRPLSLAALRGRVVLIDFWTYTCINCIRTLPYLRAWDARYRDAGLTIVGVHSPEFSFEKDAGKRPARDPIVRHPLSRRAGQQPRDVVGVAQPVLARRVPDRRAGQGAPRALRRRRLRPERERDPLAAGGARRDARREGRGRTTRSRSRRRRRRRRTSARRGRRAGCRPSPRTGRTRTRRRSRCRQAASRWAARGA